MNKFYFLFIITCIVCLMSCESDKSTSDNSNHSHINIEVNDLNDNTCISTTKGQYFKSFHRVQLESDTNTLVGNIDKVILSKDRIYIMDAKSTKAIFIFDKFGKFVNKITRKGQGPDEYIELLNMFYDEYENTINIISYSGIAGRFKIMSFDKEGNILKKQIPVDCHFREVEKLDNENYVFHSANQSSISGNAMDVSVYSGRLKRLYDGIKIHPAWLNKSTTASPKLFKSKSGCIFATSIQSTDVYQIKSHCISKCYHYDFKGLTYPDELRTPEKVNDMARNFQINNYVSDLKDFYDGENFVASIVLFKGEYRIIFYDKSDQSVNSYALRMNPLEYDSFGRYVNINNSYLITTIESSSFVKLFANPPKGFEKEVEAIKKQLSIPISEEDNPILYIYEFE